MVSRGAPERSEGVGATSGARVWYDEESDELHWPLLLLYPEPAQSDFVQDVAEGERCRLGRPLRRGRPRETHVEIHNASLTRFRTRFSSPEAWAAATNGVTMAR